MNSLPRKPRGLFLNPQKANCSIHESGRMVFECLVLSERYDLDYLEVSVHQRQIPANYDFYAFNYHHETMGWLDTRTVSSLPGLKATFILETLRNQPFVLCPSQAFDAYCALDPTMNVADKRVYAFPRPLEPTPEMVPYQEPPIPLIGSFGFATPGKGFELVVDAVNREFDRAKIRINIPPGTYSDPATFAIHNRDYAEYLTELCQKTAKPGVEVEVTREFMSKEELIQWCGQNTLNCFLYNRNQPGLSATTDQAISSGRPLSVSTNETFRHIHPYLKPYPLRSLKESIAQSEEEIKRLQEDWQPKNFALRFEQVLADFQVFEKAGAGSLTVGKITLGKNSQLKAKVRQAAKSAVLNLAPPLLLETVLKVRNRNIVTAEEALAPKMLHYSHGVLESSSQFGEDLLLDQLLGTKKDGFYVDVGANDPTFNSNTKRFYDRGWSGINIEPGLTLYKELVQARPRDVNLNVGVGSQAAELTFYQITADPSLSSFDQTTANRMAAHFGLAVDPVQIQVLPLREILARYGQGRTIDFLSVDAEGVDLDVLKSNDWTQYRPSLVLVEMNSDPKAILNFMSECSYLFIFNNEYNGLFVDLKTTNENLRILLEKNYQ